MPREPFDSEVSTNPNLIDPKGIVIGFIRVINEKIVGTFSCRLRCSSSPWKETGLQPAAIRRSEVLAAYDGVDQRLSQNSANQLLANPGQGPKAEDQARR